MSCSGSLLMFKLHILLHYNYNSSRASDPVASVSSVEFSEAPAVWPFCEVSSEDEFVEFEFSPVLSVSFFTGFSTFGFGLGILLTLVTYISIQEWKIINIMIISASFFFVNQGRKSKKVTNTSITGGSQKKENPWIPCLEDQIFSHILLQMWILAC